MSDELKPCPFCGAAAEQPWNTGEPIAPWRICCSACTGEGPCGDTRAEVVGTWNARAGDAEYMVQIDRRDLFDFVRGAIKNALESVECAEPCACMPSRWTWEEATNRATEVVEKLTAKPATPKD